jgi:hypothetical protein
MKYYIVFFVCFIFLFGKYCDVFSKKNLYIYVSCVLVGLGASVSNGFLREIILKNIKRSLFSQKAFTSCDKSLTALQKDRRYTLVSSSRDIEVDWKTIDPLWVVCIRTIRHFSLDFTLSLLHCLLGPGFRVTKAGKLPMSGF